MSKVHDVDAKAISTTKSRDLLQTKYFCQVSQKKVVEVVMAMTAIETSMARRWPLRYVLVIDVSGSMNDRVGDGIESLLDRVKIFAELVIQNVTNKDSIALVTFSHDVEVNFPMTVMKEEAKISAKNIVSGLHIRGQTNLEIGLLTGLNELKKNPSENSRDLIIVFTDGMANRGETDPQNLVEKYKDAQASLGNASCVPLSTFTIGQYVPEFLDQLASHLGSEAFYWLNENEEFEADMLIPVFLSEETRVTDVEIEMKCLEGVTFSSTDISQKHLQKASDDSLNYFFHSIPMGIKKHLPFTLLLPQDKLEDLDEKIILDIHVAYLDGKADEKRQINDFVELSLITLASLQLSGGKTKAGGIMNEVSAFSISHNEVSLSWTTAQQSLVAVAREKFRRLTLLAISNVMYNISNDDVEGRNTAQNNAILEINKVKKQYTTLLGDRWKYITLLAIDANYWIDKLTFGKTIKSKGSLGRLFAMQSSIATEMPTAKGVFDPKIKQPYLPPRIEKKLRHNEKLVQKTKKEKQTFQTFQTSSRVFKAQYVMVSESLRDKQVEVRPGARKETLSELIKRCGGTPVPNVSTVSNDTFLVCSRGDFKRNTVLVRDATRAKIPIVQENFIYDCIRERKILDLQKYLLNPGDTKMTVT